jgi:erythromycin esterase
MKLLWIGLIVTSLGALVAQAPDPLRRPELATDEEIAFHIPNSTPAGDVLAGHAIRSLVSDDFSDLAFLRELLDGVRVVQLGESGHGMAESSLLKARLVRFLHHELGFGVVAFESDLYQCFDADRTAGDDPPRTTLLKCLFGVWHTEEVLPLFKVIEESRAGSSPLRLAGFDIQPIGRNKEHRPDFLARMVGVVDSSYAAEVLQLDSTFLAEYSQGSRSRRAYFRDHRDSLLSRYDSLTEFLATHREHFEAAVGREPALVATQTVRSIAVYVRQQTAPDLMTYAETRDRGMADNVRFLLKDLFPEERIIVWAHNSHIRHANQDIPVTEGEGPRVAARAMGSWLRDWLGEELYTVGLYAFEGEAVNNSREPYTVSPARPRLLEHRLAGAAKRILFLDLDEALDAPNGSWVLEPQIVRYNGIVDQQLVPTDQYDAVVLIGTVSTPTFLW